MVGWNIWVASNTTGTMMEIPARAPGLPSNLWIHVAVNSADWIDLSSLGSVMADWKRSAIFARIDVEPGDIPVTGVACIGLAGIQRQEQGIFDSDTWGVALDSFGPTSPGSMEFSGDFATSGLSWPGGIWLLADILVLRPSLIPPVPVPYGTYPPPSHRWGWLLGNGGWSLERYAQLIHNAGNLTGDQLALLRRMHAELGEALASEPWKAAGQVDAESLPKPTIKPAKVSLRIMGMEGAGGAPTTDRQPGAPERKQPPQAAPTTEPARPASPRRKRR